MFSPAYTFFILKLSMIAVSALCPGDGWVEFEDSKCYKLIQSFANRSEAENLCYKKDNLSTLGCINFQLEQDFITNYVFKQEETRVSIWIGGYRDNSTGNFTLSDNSVLEYSNWEHGSPSEENSKKCVEMHNRLEGGQWRDANCNDANFVLCEKRNVWSSDQLQDVVMQQRKALRELSKITVELSATRSELAVAKLKLQECLYLAKKTKDLESFQSESVDKFTTLQNNLVELKSNNTTSKTNYLNNHEAKNKLPFNKLDSQLSLTSTQSELISFKENANSQFGVLQSSLQNLDSKVDNIQADLSSFKAQANEKITPLQTDVRRIKRDAANVNDNPVPVDFIYIQLPNQQPPSSIWPLVHWTDVTSQYAGLFFRAEGGGSEAFGLRQSENSPRLIRAERSNDHSATSPIDINAGSVYSPWLDMGRVSGGSTLNTMRFMVSGGEVRPTNSAVRIWRRN